MNRQDYIYKLNGRITEKKKKKKKNGDNFIQLGVIIEDKEKIKKINVFGDSCEKEEIWQAIEKNKYLGKNYLFDCKNFMGSYYLIDWKELTPQRSKLLENGKKK